MLKKTLLIIVKLLTIVGIFYWLVSTNKLDISLLQSLHFNKSLYGLLMYASLQMLFCLLVLTYRWTSLLKEAGIYIPFQLSFRLDSISNLFCYILPGAVSGDLIKAVYLIKNLDCKRRKVVSVTLLDRIIGTYALFFLGSLGSIIYLLSNYLHSKTFSLFSIALYSPALIVFGLVVIFVCQKQKKWILKIPSKKIQKKLTTFYDNWLAIGLTARGFTKAFALSLINYLLCFYLFHLVISHFTTPPPFYLLMIIIPIGLSANMIPLSPVGIGISEGVFYFLFAKLGYSDGASYALLFRLMQAAIFIFSGLVSFSFTPLKFKKRQVVTA